MFFSRPMSKQILPQIPPPEEIEKLKQDYHYDYLSIITYGGNVGSPYLSRRSFVVELHTKYLGRKLKPIDLVRVVKDRLLTQLATPTQTQGVYALKVISYNEWFNYLKSFCKFCKFEPKILCFRHLTAEELPVGNISNHEYEYNFVWSKDVTYLYFIVGASGWRVYGELYNNDITKSYIVIKRPNNVIFTYRNHANGNGINTFRFIVSNIIDFLEFIESVSFVTVKQFEDGEPVR